MKPQQRRNRKAARRAQRLACRSGRTACREARRFGARELPAIGIVNVVDDVTGDVIEHVVMLQVRRSTDQGLLAERLEATGAEVEFDSWALLTVICPTARVVADALAIAREYWREEAT